MGMPARGDIQQHWWTSACNTCLFASVVRDCVRLSQRLNRRPANKQKWQKRASLPCDVQLQIPYSISTSSHQYGAVNWCPRTTTSARYPLFRRAGHLLARPTSTNEPATRPCHSVIMKPRPVPNAPNPSASTRSTDAAGIRLSGLPPIRRLVPLSGCPIFLFCVFERPGPAPSLPLCIASSVHRQDPGRNEQFSTRYPVDNTVWNDEASAVGRGWWYLPPPVKSLGA